MAGILPLMKERDEPDGTGERLGSDEFRETSATGDPALTLRPKTWIVPLSLETASHSAVGENAKL